MVKMSGFINKKVWCAIVVTRQTFIFSREETAAIIQLLLLQQSHMLLCQPVLLLP